DYKSYNVTKADKRFAMDVPWTSFFIHFTFILFTLHFTSTFKQQGSCYFPARWEGTWFQSGVRQPIVIEGPRLSNKGRCLGSEGDKFLVVDENHYFCSAPNCTILKGQNVHS
ncbi:hypothetical protein NQ315_012015, partial [Exocentrus adspersus]